MGLSSFHCAAEGVLPVLVMNTVFSVALLKNMLRSVLQVMGGQMNSEDFEENPAEFSRERRVSVAQFKSFRSGLMVECCVCLCGFEDEQEVSELSCKHFFHTSCLDKWFDSNRTTCPLCRSID